MQDITPVIAAIESLMEFKREFLKGQGKKTRGSSKGGGDQDKSPKKESLPKTSERVRRMRHQRSTYASYAMDLTESLDALDGVSLLPLSKNKRSKRRRGGSPRSSYSMPYKPRWKDIFMGECIWRPSSIASHYKIC